MNLAAIARGWYNYIHGSAEIKQMMDYRLAICDECPKKMPMSPTGQLLMLTINKDSSTYLCGQCGCALAPKTSDPKSECPLKKWLAFTTPESYYP